MTHTDPELLSLIALGERVGTDDDRSHVQTCPTCADEVSDLRRLVTLVRSVGPDTELTVPDPRVWARIRDELDLPRAPVPAATHPEQSLLAVVAAALRGPVRGSAALVAHATLAPVRAGSSPASGEAVMATDELGRRILQVVLAADPPHAGVRHAWLVHRDDPTLRQALGILDGPYGVWTVDRSIDLEQYATVDISQQSANETEHSGETLVRGRLTLVS
ncbi:MAG TPA: hypothetical protein VFR88_12655 [Microlunatus sp.]|nr:hypothetical protein [Microlunatus sp.]